ncbi:patatin family protein, partial [Candidatus Acetothermia bacterium]
MRRKLKIGLALGGGGARGFAHLGIIMALEEHGIPIDVITGTSMGAAVGAAKALGMDLGKLHSVLSLLNLNSLLGVSESTSHEIRRAIGRGVVEYMR